MPVLKVFQEAYLSSEDFYLWGLFLRRVGTRLKRLGALMAYQESEASSLRVIYSHFIMVEVLILK